MTPKPCILIHYHEISLKGDNRRWFEKIFKRNVRTQVKPLPYASVETNAARVFIFGIDSNRWDEYAKELKKVMGLMNAHLMHSVEAEIDAMKTTATELISHKKFETFRVSTKRQYKNFPFTSQEVNQEIGAHLQSICNKRVKLKGADLNARDKKNNTPLDVALNANNTKIASYLINSGAKTSDELKAEAQ